LVGGKVTPPDGVNLAGHTIEFVNETMQPPWRSGQVVLSPDGAFMTSLSAQKGPENKFLIELRDASGTKVSTTPDHLTYVVTVVNTDQPLIHSLGIGLPNNEMCFWLLKGEALPTRIRSVYRLPHTLRCGQAEDVFRLPFFEGENSRADRNRAIGCLEITGRQIKRDLPMSSEVEVTLEIDRSRLVLVKAYVPVLDEEFKDVLKLGVEKPGREKLDREFDSEKARLEKLRDRVKQLPQSAILKALSRIEAERLMEDVECALTAMTTDPDAGDKCRNRLLDFRSALDEAEEEMRRYQEALCDRSLKMLFVRRP
jgi:molecular chaperone DnaK